MPSPVKAEKLNDYEFRVAFSVIYSYRGAQPSASGIRNIKLTLKPNGTTYLIAAISKADLR